MASPRDESNAAAAQAAQAHIASRGSVTASWSDQRGRLSMTQRQSSQDVGSTPSPSPSPAAASAAAPPPASAKVRAPPPPPSRPKAPPVYVPSEALSSVPIPAYMHEGIQLALKKQNSQEAAKTRRGSVSEFKGDIDTQMHHHTADECDADAPTDIQLSSPTSAAAVAAATSTSSASASAQFASPAATAFLTNSSKAALSALLPSPATVATTGTAAAAAAASATASTAGAGGSAVATQESHEKRSVKFSSKKLCYAASIELGKTRVPPPHEVARKSCVSPQSLVNEITVANLKAYRAREKQMSDYVKQLLVGAQLMKFSESGKPQSRFVQLDANLELVRWGSSEGSSMKRSESLCDCIAISYGTRTSKRLVDYDALNGRPWLCFSLNLGHRTFDLECSSDAQLNAWLFGLQSLTHINAPISRGRVLWERAKLKVEQRAARAKTTPMDMWLKMIAVAQASGPFVAIDDDAAVAYPVSPLASMSAVAASAIASSSASKKSGRFFGWW